MIITVKVLVVKQKSDYYKKDAIIYVKIKENVTLREFFVSLIKQSTKMKQAKHFLFLYIGDYLKKSALDQTLENLKFSQDCFCTVEITDEFEEDRFKVFDDSMMIFNVQDLSGQQKQDVESESRRKIELKNKNNWPLLRIIIGIADLLLLAAAMATFLLNIHIVATAVLAALFVVGAILFFGWNTILPKILPKGCLEKLNLETDLNKQDKIKIREIENDGKNDPNKRIEGNQL